MKDQYDIVVVPGDGIGPEVARSALAVLQAADAHCLLNFSYCAAGAELFRQTGVSLPDETLEACHKADAVLHGAAGLPGVVKDDGTEAGLDFTLTLRSQLDLFANVRPIKLLDGVNSALTRRAKWDYVIVRENSEGLYAARGAGVLLRDQTAIDTLVQTRLGIERVVRFAFELARGRHGAPHDGKKRVTCCDKANVLRSYAFFRKVFDEIAAEYPDVEAEHCLVDAMTVHLVLKPDHYDVIVTENMFGDIISDLGAATVGGLGMAPSSEVGTAHGLFQASHGSAPDIANKDVANPYGTVVAAIGMLEWLGRGHDDARLLDMAARMDAAVAKAYGEGANLTRDLGGQSGTAAMTATICGYL